MGDKDINELFGNTELFIGEIGGEMKPLGVIADAAPIIPDIDWKEEELNAFCASMSMAIPALDMPSFLGFDPAKEGSQRTSLIVYGKPKINKPHNLKYPNKKRARRVWKKWAKRYGTSPGKMIYLPNVEVECSPERVSATAKPINQE
ncbi:hypothetical protein [Muribaculum intestinale]|uniref:hypothetical protein n=1 Tax=Muribaculum intestinale TaxID=1796646 RepID=UPI0025B642BC|nr:hypothetical protein [Muribaculum intestinale]